MKAIKFSKRGNKGSIRASLVFALLNGVLSVLVTDHTGVIAAKAQVSLVNGANWLQFFGTQFMRATFNHLGLPLENALPVAAPVTLQCSTFEIVNAKAVNNDVKNLINQFSGVPIVQADLPRRTYALNSENVLINVHPQNCRAPAKGTKFPKFRGN